MKVKVILFVIMSAVIIFVMTNINMTDSNAQYPPPETATSTPVSCEDAKSLQEYIDCMDALVPQEVIPLVSSVCHRQDVWGNYPALFFYWGWPATGTTSHNAVLYIQYWWKAPWGWVDFGTHYAYLSPYGWSNNNFWWVGSTDPFGFDYKYRILDAWIVDGDSQIHFADNVPTGEYYCPRTFLPLLLNEY